MRRITIWLLSTVSALVLLFSYRTSTMGATGLPTSGAPPVSSGGAGGGVAGGNGDDRGGNGGDDGGGAGNGPIGGSDGGSGSTGSGSTGAGSGSTGGGTSGGKTYDGSTVPTRWGPVQVRVTVAGGKMTDVTPLVYPNSNFRDQQINAYALPQLRTEALQAQSANIDTVSGATVTSDGYIQSLQSALDAAHLG